MADGKDETNVEALITTLNTHKTATETALANDNPADLVAPARDLVSSIAPATKAFTELAKALRAENEKDGRNAVRVELGHDVTRLLVAWVPAAFAFCLPGPMVGCLVVLIAVGYILVIIAAVSAWSDRTYRTTTGLFVRDLGVGKKLFMCVPSKLLAIFLVAGLFCAVSWGFAGMYMQYTDPGTGLTFTHESALQQSFLTLATFDGPPTGSDDSLRRLVVQELRVSLLLTLGILGLLINRLSEWNG